MPYKSSPSGTRRKGQNFDKDNHDHAQNGAGHDHNQPGDPSNDDVLIGNGHLPGSASDDTIFGGLYRRTACGGNIYPVIMQAVFFRPVAGYNLSADRTQKLRGSAARRGG